MFGRSKKREGDGQTPHRVVILGGGYGGVYAALELQKAARAGKIHLTLVSRNNFFLFQPMLSEVVSGDIEPPHIVNPIRRLCPHTYFYVAEVEGVDTVGRYVAITHLGHQDYRYLPYDHLIIAVGSSADLSSMPGLAEHAFPFKTMWDALFLRNHLIGTLEQAEVEEHPEHMDSLLTFVVVGGGYVGVELAAGIHDFAQEAAKSYNNIDPNDIKVILLQGGDRILPELNEGLAAFSHRLMERRGLDIRLNTRIAGATGESAILSDGTTISTRTLIAAMGAAPNRLLDRLPCLRGPKGRLAVDETLAVPDYPGLWAVGDCAAIPDIRQGGTCPPTAQYALREAKHVARNVLAVINGGQPRSFSYKSLGVFVPLGKRSAAAEVLRWKVSGFLAWWMYRTYYWLQLPRLDRKLKVLLDWNLSLLFPRDIVQQGTTRSEALSRVHYEAGQVIFHQGELARSFYIILEGRVQVFRQQDGQETAVATLGRGEYFGEMSLLNGVVRHTASVRALTPVDLLTMNGEDFTTLADSSIRFGEVLHGVMRERLSGSDHPEPSS